MDPFTTLGLIGGGSNVLKGLFGLLGHKNKNNPANAANKQLDQIPGQTKPYYDPYINAGKDSLETLKNQYGQLTNDPGKRYAELGAGYTQSPGYQATLREALSGANNAAALGGAGGLGSYGHEELAAGAAGDVANKDFNDYMTKVLGLYGTGLEGEGNLNQQGFDASGKYADILGQVGGQKAAYKYAGQDWKNKNNAQDWSNLFSGAGQAGGAYALGPLIEQYFKNYAGGGA